MLNVPISDVAIALGEPYRVAYDRVLRGELGPVARQGRRILVDRGALDRLVAQRPAQRPQSDLPPAA